MVFSYIFVVVLLLSYVLVRGDLYVVSHKLYDKVSLKNVKN